MGRLDEGAGYKRKEKGQFMPLDDLLLINDDAYFLPDGAKLVQ